MTRRGAFASLVLDVDSTLTRIEGIEWLAARQGPAVARAVTEMTERAMNGTAALDAVYSERLALVRPSRSDVEALAQAYVRGAMAGAADAVRTLRDLEVTLAVVSGGVRQAVVPFAMSLGFTADEVHAVDLAFTPDGEYAGFDTTTPLVRRGGKPALVRQLGLPRPVLALGDGNTDAELKTDATEPMPAVDAFAAFVGVARRASVVAVADYVVDSFAELPALVQGAEAPSA